MLSDTTMTILIITSVVYVIGKMILDIFSEIDIKKGLTPQEAKEKYDFSLKGIKRRKNQKQLYKDQEERTFNSSDDYFKKENQNNKDS